MEQIRSLSCLGKIGLIMSHSLALILISWYSLIQIGVVQYDDADMFGVLLLFSLPFGVLILIVQLFDLMQQPVSERNNFLIWGCVVSGLIVLTSGIAWIQLILFFSSLGGTTFG
ncbi:MAG: hypothetical protein AB8G95_02500 [Anaerolineae bacterium]